MRSLLAQFSEWMMSRSSPRFKLFRSARLRHEAYIQDRRLVMDSLTPEQRRDAAGSVELRKVEDSYRESLKLTVADGANKNAAIVHQQLGLLYFMRGELAPSRASYAESLSILKNQAKLVSGDLDAMSTCQVFFALIALEQGDRVLARKEILEAIEIDEQLNNPWSLQMDQRILARCQ